MTHDQELDARIAEMLTLKHDVSESFYFEAPAGLREKVERRLAESQHRLRTAPARQGQRGELDQIFRMLVTAGDR